MSEPRYGYDTENKVKPVTSAERIHWKQLEINRFEHMAKLNPRDAQLYRLAAERLRGEIEAIQRIPR